MIERTLHILIGLLFFATASGQEVPKIIHFTSQDYQAQNQNWDIAQRNDLQLFVGNSSGLLQFDGARWKLRPLPSGQPVRTVECDASGRVFVGGYETIGYWEADQEGHFSYHSLLDLVEGDGLGNEEIWHILLTDGKVMFQSFSAIYVFDGQTVKMVRPPGNVMFARKIGKDIIVPVIDIGLFRFLEDGTFEKIPGSEIFDKMLVSAMLPYGKTGFLVCTQNNGVFRYDGNLFLPWQVTINQELIKNQLNKGLQLRDSSYVFGTILGGIFITDKKGQLLSTISQENGLQNNTVLSLFQDKAGQLWTGLDNGIDQIVLDSPLRFFQDNTGETGTVYTAAIFDNNLYLGTNHGVFFKKHPSGKSEKLKLINGSQGQVWDLQIFDNQLIGGHNSGTLHIRGNQLKFLFNGTGVYGTVRHPERPDILLQGTYTGVIVLQKNTEGQWELGHGVEGFFQSARKLLFDKKNRLWVLHARKGLFRLILDESLKQSVETISFDERHGLPSIFQLDMSKIGNEIVFKSGSQFFTYDEEQNLFIRKESIGNQPLPAGNSLLQAGHNGDWFSISANQIQYYHNEESDIFRLSLVRGSEQIIALSDNSYLFCLDDGYALLPPRSTFPIEKNIPALPLLTGVLVGKNKIPFHGPASFGQPHSFAPYENQLTFQFACPHFTFQPAIRYRLLGFDEKWSPYETLYTKEFTNLPPGDFEFQIQSELSEAVARFRFTIQPKWYQTPWARTIYLLLLIGSLSLLLKWHKRRMDVQKQKLEQEKERELEQQRTHANNEMLQAEILNKTRILADTTMNLIRKNEMLMKIKEELEVATHQHNPEPPARALTKMEHLIETHLTNEEDWQVFEANFNQLHDQFFKRLKDQYPNLTPGDMRLAAYLKMNLATKDIAPLLNISVRGVENKRYRLRQKMGLDGEVNLTEYLMGY